MIADDYDRDISRTRTLYGLTRRIIVCEVYLDPAPQLVLDSIERAHGIRRRATVPVERDLIGVGPNHRHCLEFGPIERQ